MNAETEHPACQDPKSLVAACDVRRQRRSGPGGQHRNKVETGIFLRHRASGIEASATERRSQEANRRVAVERLRFRLAVNLRTAIRGEQSASDRWTSRLAGGRIQCSVKHEDFPALLAEALDFLAAESWNHTAAAARLGCTASQLVKLLKKSPEAFTKLNTERQVVGKPALK
jgi:hypothetical protein